MTFFASIGADRAVEVGVGIRLKPKQPLVTGCPPAAVSTADAGAAPGYGLIRCCPLYSKPRGGYPSAGAGVASPVLPATLATASTE